jgi:hypothetical protein
MERSGEKPALTLHHDAVAYPVVRQSGNEFLKIVCLIAS